MQKNSVLIAEDENIIAIDIARKVERLGYKIKACVSNAKDAVEKTLSTSPSIVIMDINLKGKPDGIEAAAEIRKHTDIPVIYLTAYANASIMERAKKTEPFHYLVKPFDEDELRTTLEIALENKKIEKKLEKLNEI